MRFLIDECLFRQIQEGLRDDEHDVGWVRDVCPGADDDTVLSKALQEGRVLITEHKDFAELTVRF